MALWLTGQAQGQARWNTVGRGGSPARGIGFVSLVAYGPKVSDSALAIGGYSFWNQAGQFPVGKESVSTNGAGTIGNPYVKDEVGPLPHTIYKKMNSEGMKDLNVSAKPTKLLEGNIGALTPSSSWA